MKSVSGIISSLLMTTLVLNSHITTFANASSVSLTPNSLHDSNIKISANASANSHANEYRDNNNITDNDLYDDYVLQFLMRYKQKNEPHYDDLNADIVNNNNNNNSNNDNNDDEGEKKTRRINSEDFVPTTPARFIGLCKDFLLSDDIIEDDEITNIESALFFEHLCNELPKPSCQNDTIPFYSLSILMQLEFVDVICPRDEETDTIIDTECLKILKDQVEQKNEFGYVINRQERDLDQDLENYCTNLYALSGDYHFGTYEPSPSPSMQPSIEPSPSIRSNSVEYKVAFTYMIGFDDAIVQSSVLADARLDIMESTSNAIKNVLYERAPDMIGPSNISGRRAVMRSLRGSSTKVSDLSPVEALDIEQQQKEKRSRHLEKLTFSTENDDGVEHKFLKDQECAEEFTLSSTCIIIVSEVTLESSTQRAKETVNESVFSSIKSSMDDDSFRIRVNFDEVKEVKYIGNGNDVPLGTPQTGGANVEGVGGGSIAGITVGSVLFFVVLAFFIGRGRARSEDDSDQSNDSSDLYEDDVEGDLSNSDSEFDTTDAKKYKMSRDLPIIEENNDGSNVLMRGTGDQYDLATGQVVKSNDTSYENKVPSKVLMRGTGVQFDLESGQVIGSAAMSYGSSYNSVSSGYSADNHEITTKSLDEDSRLVYKLDDAVHAGDWGAVADIASEMSQADDISEMSSRYSRAGDISYDASERDGNLSAVDAKRARQIDKHIAEGNWHAVGATAAAFSSETGSEASSSPEFRESSRPTDTRKTILDFIAGPWNSTSAMKAIQKEDESDEILSASDPEAPFANFSASDTEINGEKEAPISNLNTNKNMSSSETSDLSVGLAERQSSQKDALAGLGETFGVARAPYNSESDTTTDDDTRKLINDQKKKRSWSNRILRKKNGEKESTSKSLPFQEDSSVSSWSRGEDSSPETSMNIYGSSTHPIDDMPPEMKAFGEDHGLAAAERAMEEEERKEENTNDSKNSDSELSQKSSSSLRDVLDKAIESGDWSTVEQQTSEMFTEVENDVSSRDVSDVDSDVDTDGIEEWSHNNQTDDDTEVIDDERIEILEKLIETDDWQGIVNNSQIHTNADDSDSVVSEEN